VVSTYRILYVDDEPDLLEIGKLFLEQRGQFRVDTSTSAPAALTLVNSKDHDAIISDYQMPEMDGIEFLKKIRTSGNTVPFILFTGKGREEVVIQALNEGADFYLQKGGEPVSQFTELAHQIRQAVRRREAESALRNAVRDWETTFAATSDGICLLDPSQKIIRCNPRMMEIARVSPGEALAGYTCWTVMHGTSSHIAECPVVSMMTSLKREHAEIQMNNRWFDVIADPVLDVSGNLTGIVHTMRDITEQKQAESELRAAYEQLTAQEEELRDQYDEIAQREREVHESEEKFRGVFNNANDEIYIHGILPDGSPGKFIEVNRTMSIMLGYSRDELLRMTIKDIVSEEHRKNMAQIGEIFERNGTSTFTAEHRRKDGSVFPVEVNLQSVSLSGKKIVIAIARDITGRKRIERAIELANKKMNLMNTITRHNILNIFTGLSGSVDMALDTRDKARRDALLNQIKELAALILHQIEFSILYEEVGVREPVWMAVEEILGHVSMALGYSDARIMTDLAGIEVYADPLFEKVVYSLLDNAIRHGKKVTAIRFSGKIVDNRLILTCEDDGIGIPPGMKEKIFEKREGQDHGSALFLVREILTITGITIRETGSPGKGARFEMAVPNSRYRICL
jgi:PAS domain S-box-containing protein